jgi:hypothetical protein
MTNDAKLGMLAGVLGVIVAAVMFANTPPPAQSRPEAADPRPPPKPAPTTATGTPPAIRDEALASTPVARTRKEVDGQSTSRTTGADEEP